LRIWEKAADFDPGKGSPLAWMATIGHINDAIRLPEQLAKDRIELTVGIANFVSAPAC
jgi:hypothetical protein